MIAFIIFRDLDALKRIPEAGEEFIVLAPEIPKKPIHEIGVNDIEAYAGNDEFQPAFQFDRPEKDTTKRVIGGNIRHSRMSSLLLLNIRKTYFTPTSNSNRIHFQTGTSQIIPENHTKNDGLFPKLGRLQSY
jgi:hypothetical protein